MTTARKLAEYVRHKLHRLECCLDETLTSGSLESVHGLRVTSRRLHEPAEILVESGHDGEWRAARRELKRIRGAFRKVRDLDVLLHSLVAASSSGGLTGELGGFESGLARRRLSELERAQRRCRKLKARRTIRGLQDVCDRIEALADDGAIPALIDQRLAALAGTLLADDPRLTDAHDLHDARIRVKRLRYSAELAREVAARPAEPLIAALTCMQELLGRWNDHISAARCLARLASGRKLLARSPVIAAQLLDYAAGRARSAEAERQSVFAAWEGLTQHVREWSSAGDAAPQDEPGEASAPPRETLEPCDAVAAAGPAGRETITDDTAHA